MLTSVAVKHFYEELIESNDTLELKDDTEIETLTEAIPEEHDILSLFSIEDTNDSIEEDNTLPWTIPDKSDHKVEAEELPWDSTGASHKDDKPKRRSPIYDEVMSMDDETANSCLMYRTIRKHESAYAEWTSEEDEQLILEAQQGLGVKKMAEIHERTVGAIRSRIRKLIKRLREEEENETNMDKSCNLIGLNTNNTDNSNSMNNINKKSNNSKNTQKSNFWISFEEAQDFYYEDSMSVGEMRDRLNTLKGPGIKAVTGKQILDYIYYMGYGSEEFIDGVWRMMISEKGKRVGLHHLEYETSIGTKYKVYGLSRRLQEMIVEFFTK